MTCIGAVRLHPRRHIRVRAHLLADEQPQDGAAQPPGQQPLEPDALAYDGQGYAVCGGAVMDILNEFRALAGIRGRNAHRGSNPPQYDHRGSRWRLTPDVFG